MGEISAIRGALGRIAASAFGIPKAEAVDHAKPAVSNYCRNRYNSYMRSFHSFPSFNA